MAKIDSFKHARNISVLAASEIVFIKTYPGGSGYVTNVTWENFRSKACLYGVNLNQYWQQTFTPDTGAVALSNITFKNFSGKDFHFSVPFSCPYLFQTLTEMHMGRIHHRRHPAWSSWYF